jgi:hypothetical protein
MCCAQTKGASALRGQGELGASVYDPLSLDRGSCLLGVAVCIPSTLERSMLRVSFSFLKNIERALYVVGDFERILIDKSVF